MTNGLGPIVSGSSSSPFAVCGATILAGEIGGQLRPLSPSVRLMAKNSRDQVQPPLRHAHLQYECCHLTAVDCGHETSLSLSFLITQEMASE